MLSLLLVLIFLGQSMSLRAQPEQISFSRFTDEDGLPNNSVRKVIQARDGMLWIASANELATFDGYDVVTYRHEPTDSTTLSGKFLLNLYEDSKGRLWVSSYGHGVNLSNPSKTAYRFLRWVNDTIAHHTMNIAEIAEDGNGFMWLATNEGLVILREEHNSFIRLDSTDIVSDQHCEFPVDVTTLLTGKDSTMYVGTGKGMYRIDAKNKRVNCPDDFVGLPQNAINMIGHDRAGRLWVSCIDRKDRLYYESSPGHFTVFRGIPFDTTFREAEFVFDHDNRIWVTIFGDQAYGYDFRDSTLFFQSKFTNDINYERFFRTPFVDKSGMVWLLGEGLYKYAYPKGFHHYEHPYNFHQSNRTIHVNEDFYYFSYREKGLVRVDRKNFQTVLMSSEENADEFIPENHIVELVALRNGHTLLVCFGRIVVLDTENKMIRNHEVIGTNRSAMEDSKGRIWMGGIAGLHLFSEDSGVVKTYKLPSFMNDGRNFVQVMVEDANGLIWFGSDNKGMGRLNPETGELRNFLPLYGDTTSLPSSSVNDILIDRKGMFWLATDNGFARFDPATERMHTYNHRHGLKSDYVCSLVLDDQDVLWMATQSGVSSFDITQHSIVNYGLEDGLINAGYYDRAKEYSSNGIIYFGGKNGVDFFDPHELRNNASAPMLRLISFNTIRQGKSESHLAADTYHLSYNDDLIEIKFSGMHYTDQENIRYMYRLEPLHEEWVELGNQRSVLFSNLKPGKYIFHVKASTPDGIWSVQDLIIPIFVAPPFYLTHWFRILLISMLVVAIYWYIKYREKLVENRQRKESDISRQIMELEKRALQAQMNPHFIYNSMNSIQQFIIVHDTEGAMKYLTRFSRILRTVLNMSAQSRIPLYEEINLIEDYLELENMRFPDKFTYEIKVAPELNIHSAEIPPFFIQPQVENAIRHGLLKKTTPGHLCVEIKTDGDQLFITVEDNGIGREASQKMKYAESKTHVSKGLSIVEERLRHLQNTNGHQPFKITDLYDRLHQPLGTRVEITLPMD